jgi:hypothetical protein
VRVDMKAVKTEKKRVVH